MTAYYDRYAKNTEQVSPTQFSIRPDKKAYNHSIDIGPITATSGTITLKGKLVGGNFRDIKDGYGAVLSCSLASPDGFLFSGNYEEIQVNASGLSGGNSDFYVALSGR